MKRTRYGCCPPKKKKCKRPSQNWIVLLCVSIIICGILLLRG